MPLKLTKEQFINKANEVHNNFYDYSNFVYINSKIKGIIICPKHGEFEQAPSEHISKKHPQGCKICGYIINTQKRTSNTKEFIEKAKIIHGDKYDYSLVDYTKALKKVKIICLKHGIFEQVAADHLMGRGCRKCKFSKGEKLIQNYLKENNINFDPQKTFNDCKNKNVLPFDFYLPEFNLCIEYQGRQHFEEIKGWGGKLKLEHTKLTDSIKKNYCLSKNIKLLEIPYYENILDILNHHLISLP